MIYTVDSGLPIATLLQWLMLTLTLSPSAGPLGDPRPGWSYTLKPKDDDAWPPVDGAWRSNPPGYPVPTDTIEDIITITDADARFWDDWVCVGPVWPEDYVSPKWSVASMHLTYTCPYTTHRN